MLTSSLFGWGPPGATSCPTPPLSPPLQPRRVECPDHVAQFSHSCSHYLLWLDCGHAVSAMALKLFRPTIAAAELYADTLQALTVLTHFALQLFYPTLGGECLSAFRQIDFVFDSILAICEACQHRDPTFRL